MSTTTKYAFGNDVYEDDEICRPCPATEAGYSPQSGDASRPVAERYDSHLVEELQQSDSIDPIAYHPRFKRGVVTEADAKDAWLQAIDEAKDADLPKAAEAGREIARELGWL